MPIDPDAALIAERTALHELLAGLSDEQWDAPSACPGWRVRDVAAHVDWSTRLGVLDLVKGMVRHRGNVDAFIKAAAIAEGSRPLRERRAASADTATSTKIVPGGTVVGAALEAFVHRHDIALPLGLAVENDPERLRWLADGVVAMERPLGSGQRVKGLRLIASDIDWHYGTGPEVTGPAAAIILAACGRDTLATELDGDGVAELLRRD